MITPSFNLTATERVLPKLALDFTTASLDARVTITRALNTATRTNSSGVIEVVNANLPRFDYDPTTLVCKGLMIEESRKNLFLNSLIDGTSLTTQIVTTTAVSTTISFYGTGSVVLSGTHSATVSGTGAYPTRTTYTFTPTAGALTATVSGTVQYAQIEAGAFATSFIPTDATVGGITRNADVATMTGTNFSDWFNASEGTFVFGGDLYQFVAGKAHMVAYANSTNYISIRTAPTGSTQSRMEIGGGTNTCVLSPVTITPSGFQEAFAYKLNNCAAAVNAGTVVTDTTVDLPATTPTALNIGSNQTTAQTMCGHAAYVAYYPQRLTDAEVQAFSKQG